MLRGRFITSSLGASGAVYGILAAWCLVRGAEALRVPLTNIEVPVSSRALLGVMLAAEVFNMWTGKLKGVDHVAHLGGYVVGIGAAVWLRWNAEERRKVAEEKRREMGFLERAWGRPPPTGVPPSVSSSLGGK